MMTRAITLGLFLFGLARADVKVAVVPVPGGAVAGVTFTKGEWRQRSAVLTVASTGLAVWAIGKGLADAHTHSGDAAFIHTGNWWHVASLGQSVGGAVAAGALAYGAGTGKITYWEAVRFGVGDLMRKNVMFRAVYTGARFGEPLTLKPEYNQHLFYIPGLRGETCWGAGHWSEVVTYYAAQYYVGGWLKRNVVSGRPFLYPFAGE